MTISAHLMTSNELINVQSNDTMVSELQDRLLKALNAIDKIREYVNNEHVIPQFEYDGECYSHTSLLWDMRNNVEKVLLLSIDTKQKDELNEIKNSLAVFEALGDHVDSCEYQYSDGLKDILEDIE